MQKLIEDDIKKWFSYIFQKLGKDQLKEFSEFTILEMIEDNPDLEWSRDRVSMNPNLTIQFVLENLYDSDRKKRVFDWVYLSGNPGITMKDIKQNPDLPWDWYWVSKNPNLTIQFVKENLLDSCGNKRNWSWYEISRKPEITMKDIQEDLPWDWIGVSQNPNLTIQIIKDNLLYYNGEKRNWVWIYLSRNPGITIKDIKENLDLPWYWNWVSKRPDLTIQFVKDNLLNSDGNRRDWSWEKISCNPAITMKDIEENLNLPWDWNWISWNPNLNIQIVKDNLLDSQGKKRDWDWRYISRNPGITMKDIRENLDLPWNWNYISANPNLTIRFVKENLFDPQGNKREWSWGNIFSPENSIKEQVIIYNRHISAMKIQSWWRNIRVDERRRTGRRLVIQRFLEI